MNHHSELANFTNFSMLYAGSAAGFSNASHIQEDATHVLPASDVCLIFLTKFSHSISFNLPIPLRSNK